ncbi:hypothetical protein IMSAG049_01343 [Clostridiales bacterium]|nr:hypothetical protein IMSAG049_01343 [Clostridiales bacterium]
MKVKNIEEIINVDKNIIKNALLTFDLKTLAKASMGLSPMSNTLLNGLFPGIEKMRLCIGPVKLDEVEKIHAEIVAKVNELLDKQ